MKGLILSGGNGTRLRPFTYTIPKQLIPVANKPILFYGLEALAGMGVRDVGVVVGSTYPEIQKAVGDGSRWGLSITYVHQPKPLGLAHAVSISQDFLQDDSFVMYLGDNLIQGGLRSIVKKFMDQRPAANVFLTEVPNPRDFGVAEIESDRLVRLSEKPKNPKTNLAIMGIYLFNPEIFGAIRSIKPSARGELEITDAIQKLIDDDFHVDFDIITGWWKDAGKVQDLLDTNRLILKGIEWVIEGDVDPVSAVNSCVRLEAEARVVRSRLEGPAIIGQGALIEDSYVGPFTSIGPKAVIRNSKVENSIVMEGSSLVDLPKPIVGSIIGKNSRVSQSETGSSVYQLVLGDSNTVNLT